MWCVGSIVLEKFYVETPYGVTQILISSFQCSEFFRCWSKLHWTLLGAIIPRLPN